jgi:hypothetical protein
MSGHGHGHVDDHVYDVLIFTSGAASLVLRTTSQAALAVVLGFDAE